MTTEELPMLLSAAEINEKVMAISARTLKRAQASGLIKGKLIGGKWRFERDSLLEHFGIALPAHEPPAKAKRGRPRKEVAR